MIYGNLSHITYCLCCPRKGIRWPVWQQKWVHVKAEACHQSPWGHHFCVCPFPPSALVFCHGSLQKVGGPLTALLSVMGFGKCFAYTYVTCHFHVDASTRALSKRPETHRVWDRMVARITPASPSCFPRVAAVSLGPCRVSCKPRSVATWGCSYWMSIQIFLGHFGKQFSSKTFSVLYKISAAEYERQYLGLPPLGWKKPRLHTCSVSSQWHTTACAGFHIARGDLTWRWRKFCSLVCYSKS
jgi:hypothetical protein